MLNFTTEANNIVEGQRTCLADKIASDLQTFITMSEAQINEVKNAILGADLEQVKQGLAPKLQNEMEKVTAEITKQAKDGKSAIETAKVKSQEDKIAAVHSTQDAKKAIQYTAPQPIMKEASSTIIPDPVQYTMATDYPHSVGNVDEIKNWFKVNKATGEIEFVHTSGSYFKIDGAGNAVLHLKGSYTEIIEGDSLRQSLNSDETVLAKANNHIVTGIM